MKQFLKRIITTIIQWEAKLVLAKYQPKIIAVTGNVGKTSTKDAIYSVLAPKLFVRKSDKSFNSEIGIPLTILGVQNGWMDMYIWTKNILYGLSLVVFRHSYPKYLLLEVGADHPGDIKNVSEWLKPDVVVMTSFGEVPVHVEYFKTIEALIEEKGHLVRAVKEGGTVILNKDDKNYEYFKSLSRQRILTYGVEDGADMMGSFASILYEKKGEFDEPKGITFKVNHKGNSFPVSLLGVLGKQHIYPTLAAFLVGTTENLNVISVIESFSSHVPPRGRMRILDGVRETVLIDDSYNASPLATKEALLVLKEIVNDRKKIAILGDMMELGKYSAEEHKKIGKLVSEVADVLITVGIRARGFAEGALDGKMHESKVFQFDDSAEAGSFARRICASGDIFLVKGSQFVRMEKASKELLAEPKDAETLLVRQEEAWESR